MFPFPKIYFLPNGLDDEIVLRYVLESRQHAELGVYRVGKTQGQLCQFNHLI